MGRLAFLLFVLAALVSAPLTMMAQQELIHGNDYAYLRRLPFILGGALLIAACYLRLRALRMSPWLSLVALIPMVNIALVAFLAVWESPKRMASPGVEEERR